MAATLFVAPVDPALLDAIPDDRTYDSLLASIGYETRGRRVAEALADRTKALVGIEFAHGHNDTYRANRLAFDELGAEVLRLSDNEFVAWVGGWLADVAGKNRVRLAVDISSMSRPRIGAVVKAVADLPTGADVILDLLYAPAKFEVSPPLPDATEALEPATPDFTGEPLKPSLPLCVLFGLGYEPERAAAALDEFSPEQAFVFFPEGRDKRFTKAVGTANKDVLALPHVGEPIRYAVSDPFRCFAILDAIVRRVLENGMRPLLLPLGPKVFAAVCFLVAVTLPTSIPVWRVSSGVFSGTPDREANNELVTLRVGTQPLRDKHA
jgi:hypothetical protein